MNYTYSLQNGDYLKSCAQYFDYDKFHQMVLGADLKGMKMDDVIPAFQKN